MTRRIISTITWQLISVLIIVAFIVIIIMAGVEVKLEYNQQLDELRRRIDNIPDVFLEIITYSLWVFDEEQLKNSIKSINQMDGIYYVKVKSSEGNLFVSGEDNKENYKSLVYDLKYNYNNKDISLGVLDIHYTLPQISEILQNKSSKIFFRVLVIVLFIFIALFILINYFIAKPISNLAIVIQQISDYSAIEFPRKRIFKKKDEIDSLFSAFNQTFEKIRIEIHERELNEQKLITSVEEKNILISEVHHRVKNNLQIILSLLYLQKNEADSIDDALNGTINRIRAMAEVHEQLYNSDNFTRISMSSYLGSLIDNMSRFSENISMIMVPGDNDIEVTLDTAIPLGLIINELILNSLKYAFPEKSGEIKVEILKNLDNYSRIEVRDNGVGINSDGGDRKTSSLGFQIIESLVGQINGKINVVSDNGLSAIVSIPVEIL